MITETYKGRLLRAKEGKKRDYGRTEFWVNGHYVGSSAGKSEQQVIEQLRRDVDAAEKRPGAYPDYWLPAREYRKKQKQ
jgi:hypothetical protein